MYNIEKNIKDQKKYSNSLYYGQWETDKIIESYFDINVKGVCIEVGAANGIRGSNTKYFEDNKWGGLCIEPNLEHKESLESSRNLVRYFACGNENKDEYLHIFRVGDKNIASSLTSLIPDERLVNDHEHLINDNYKVQVPVRTLDWILKKEVTNTSFESITDIDFISIDTEGTELDVMKGFDVTKYNVKLFVIENNYNDKDIEKYMYKIGYIKDMRYKINDFYIKKPLKNKK